jgi:hypothetical protein
MLFAALNVRFGSLAAARGPSLDVRFTTESGRYLGLPRRPLWAISGHQLVGPHAPGA